MAWPPTPEQRQRVKAANNAANSLRHLDLPRDFIKLVKSGRLGQAIAERREQYDRLTRLLDAWEAEHPQAARGLPWYEAREAWKAAGKPEPEWYELLFLFDRISAVRAFGDAGLNLLNYDKRPIWVKEGRAPKRKPSGP